MPATIDSMPITGWFSDAEGKCQLVLTKRIGGHDTFLTGALELDGRTTPVRIITLDDVTVLRPVQPDGFADRAGTCTGVLHLPHGTRPRLAPPDLVAEAAARHRTLDSLDQAELRYALTFLDEATTSHIRRSRIRVIVDALPELHDEPARPSGAEPQTGSVDTDGG